MATTILIDRAPGSWSMPESALNVVADYGAHADGFTINADNSTTAYTGP